MEEARPRRWWQPSRVGLGSETGNQILDNLSPFLLGKGIGQSPPMMVASCMVTAKFSNEGSGAL